MTGEIAMIKSGLVTEGTFCESTVISCKCDTAVDTTIDTDVIDARNVFKLLCDNVIGFENCGNFIILLIACLN